MYLSVRYQATTSFTISLIFRNGEMIKMYTCIWSSEVLTPTIQTNFMLMFHIISSKIMIKLITVMKLKRHHGISRNAFLSLL